MSLKQYFGFKHLPPDLRRVSEKMEKVFQDINDMVPECEEREQGFRKLLEARDCFVRAMLPEEK